MTEDTALSGEFTGVVDRIVDGETAVLLLEEDGDVFEQFTLSVDALPQRAQDDGGVVILILDDGELVDVTSAPDETERRRESAADRLDRLSRKLSDE